MKKFFAFNPRSVRRTGLGELRFERVEPRTMLAGDVSVFLNSGQLIVVGDDLANQIQVVGSADGSAVVTGLDSTTINGSDGAFGSGPGLLGVSVQLNGGGDSARLEGLVLPGLLELNGNAGNDSFEVLNSSAGTFVAIGGSGNDILQLDGLDVAGTSFINMGSGNDIVSVNALASGDNIGIFTGDGDDIVAINDLGMGNLLAISTGAGDDVVLLAGDTTAGSGSGIALGSGDDFLGILPGQTGAASAWGDHVSIDGGTGNDVIAMDGGVTTGRSARINARSGSDSFSPGGASFGSDMSGFNNGPVGDLNSHLDALFERLQDADINPLIFGGPELVRDLTVGSSAGQSGFTENGGPVVIDANLNVNGPRDGEIISATVQLGVDVLGDLFPQAGDVLEFDDNAGFTGDFDPVTGILTLAGVGDYDAWQSALRTVRFNNTSENPDTTDRTAVFTINSTTESDSANRTVTVQAVNDAPVLDLTDEALVFDLDDDSQSNPLPLDENLTLTDPDTPEFSLAGQVSVSIASGLRSGDELGFTPIDGIVGNFNSGTGVLAFSGTASVADLETLLRSLTFTNTGDVNETGTRIINISVFDGQLTATQNISLEVIASESIGIAVADTLQTFSEFDDPVIVDSDLTVTPGTNAPDDNADSATVEIVSGYTEGQDTLEFTPVSGVTGEFDATTGILSFSGTATAAEYQTLLRSVRFGNSATGDDLVTGDRRIEFRVVADGSTAVDTRNLRVSPASEQRVIENFLEANNLESEMTASGLHYIIEQEGNGQFPTLADSVTVNYTGFLLDGTIFDDGQDVTFQLTRVIAGWQEGIPLFSVGGSGQLIIPSNLAYGETGFPPDIGPNEILRFEIELLAVPTQPSNFEILDVCLEGHDDVVAHDHAELNILVDGQPVVIEGDIGINDSQCTGLRGMHTHDATGRLHIETPAPMDAPLSAFFEIWGQTFNQNQILDNVANSGKEVVMFVNGQLNNQFENYLVQDDDVIDIHYRDRTVG